MEKIRINSIELKGPAKTICVVNYNNENTQQNGAEATLNTKWQSKEIYYLMKDIGIGNECEVEIKHKGQYTNITEVKMDKQSAPGGVQNAPTLEVNPSLNTPAPQEVKGLMSQRDASIVAQVCLKGAVELAKVRLKDVDQVDNETLGEYLCMAVNELVGAYNVALDKLNG